jgi:hypothetical protein
MLLFLSHTVAIFFFSFPLPGLYRDGKRGRRREDFDSKLLHLAIAGMVLKGSRAGANGIKQTILANKSGKFAPRLYSPNPTLCAFLRTKLPRLPHGNSGKGCGRKDWGRKGCDTFLGVRGEN